MNAVKLARLSSLLVCLSVLIACTLANNFSPATIEVVEKVLTAEPTPTEAVCTPWPEGLEMAVSVTETYRLHIDISGLLPSDTPVILAQAETVRGGVIAENSYFNPVGESGSLSDGLTTACTDAFEGARVDWDIRAIHSRGVSCLRAVIECPE